MKDVQTAVKKDGKVKPESIPGKNPLLPEDLQGRAYKITAFILQPEITLLTDGGLEERRFIAGNTVLWEVDFGLTVPEFMSKSGLKMQQGKDG